MRYTKYDIHTFVGANDRAGFTKGLTCYQVAVLFMEQYPDCDYSIATVEKHVTHSRAGRITEPIVPDIDDIRAKLITDMAANRTTAHEAFQPNRVETDLNPLGVLTEPDIKKIFFDVPETFAHHLTPHKIEGITLLGVASDLHLPIHNRQAILACFGKLKELNIDGLYLNGDVMDCASVGHHAKRRVMNYTWDQELAVGRAFFQSLRVLFPDIPIYYKMGNHEDWLPRYLAKVAPELGNQYNLFDAICPKELNITLIESSQVSRFGRLWIAHGHEIGLKGGTLNIARQVLMRTNVNILVGHWHKNDQHERRNLDESVHSAWVSGCLSDLYPDYAPANQMTHGFASVKMLDENGGFVVNPYKIVNGVVIG